MMINDRKFNVIDIKYVDIVVKNKYNGSENDSFILRNV